MGPCSSSLCKASAESLLLELLFCSSSGSVPPSHLVTPSRLLCWKPSPPHQRSLFPRLSHGERRRCSPLPCFCFLSLCHPFFHLIPFLFHMFCLSCLLNSPPSTVLSIVVSPCLSPPSRPNHSKLLHYYSPHGCISHYVETRSLFVNFKLPLL